MHEARGAQDRAIVEAKRKEERTHLPLLPTLAELVYVGPNPDGSRKRCGNCYAYIRGKRQCQIHAPTQRILPIDVCGYYVFGTPLAARTEQGIAYVEARYSGLTVAWTGTSCGRCVWYEGTEDAGGRCHGASGEHGGFPSVASLGCCSRYRTG